MFARVSDVLSENDPGEVLSADECPVCHGVLGAKDSVPWCPSCDLKFTP